MNPRSLISLATAGCLAIVFCLACIPGVHAQEINTTSTNPPIAPAAETVLAPLTGIRQVAVGHRFACALTEQGKVLCWGDNSSGQLGAGTGGYSTLPQEVPGEYGAFAAIDAGHAHACGLTASGALWCWGDNTHGQIGTGSTGPSSPPTVVSGLGGVVTDFSAGTYHTCAIVSGVVKCWGKGTDGQLGHGHYASSTSPVNVAGLSNGKFVSAGQYHTCAVTIGGAARCWGRNDRGQLGSGNLDSSDVPVDVEGLTSNVGVISAGGQHSCASVAGDDVMCWGENADGQLGDGSHSYSNTPEAVSISGTDVVSVQAGDSHTCALVQNGDVKCWGNNLSGQLGNNSVANSTLPVDIIGADVNLTSVQLGDGNTCATTERNGVLCWGDNTSGQLADGTTSERHIPGNVMTSTQCYRLSLSRIGSGSLPIAVPDHSDGCPANHYFAGSFMTISGVADADWRVNGWTGTANDKLLENVNHLLMPAADHTVKVAYTQCFVLTLSHAGDGSDPDAVPASSVNCQPGRYVEGDRFSLFANPGTDMRVQKWEGAKSTPWTGQNTNMLIMPNANRSVKVTYEACHALSANATEGGEALMLSPASSSGCTVGRYVAGQRISLSASPDEGWNIASWHGTDEDDSQIVDNVVTMPVADHTVGVSYGRQAPTQSVGVYLPVMHVE